MSCPGPLETMLCLFLSVFPQLSFAAFDKMHNWGHQPMDDHRIAHLVLILEILFSYLNWSPMHGPMQCPMRRDQCNAMQSPMQGNELWLRSSVQWSQFSVGQSESGRAVEKMRAGEELDGEGGGRREEGERWEGGRCAGEERESLGGARSLLSR